MQRYDGATDSDFLVEGDLYWRMVSTTSVERPDAMSYAML